VTAARFASICVLHLATAPNRLQEARPSDTSQNNPGDRLTASAAVLRGSSQRLAVSRRNYQRIIDQRLRIRVASRRHAQCFRKWQPPHVSAIAIDNWNEPTMRIGFTTYPVAFQRPGGLEVQIRETAAALRAIGADVRIVELYSERLSDYDIIHHFSLKHGSHRILQYARSFGIPVVATPLADPLVRPTQLHAINIARRVLHRLFRSTFSGYWDELQSALSICTRVFPLTHRERTILETFYPRIRGKCTVVANGVAERFFAADPTEFRRRYNAPSPILLLPSSIEPRKNQFEVIRAARSLGVTIAAAGPVLDLDYWERCKQLAGDSLLYLGELPANSRLLLSAFAAADCVALISVSEPFGLVPFEALAAGTPALLTKNSGVDTHSSPPWFQRVDPLNARSITTALATALSVNRDRGACRALVADMRWANAASLLLREYEAILSV